MAAAAAKPPASSSAPATLEGAPIPRYPGMRFGLPSGRKLAARWMRHRPDAIYIATEGPLGWSALRAAKRLGIPVATGFHTRFDDYVGRYGAGFLSPWVFAWLRRFHNRADATLVPTGELMAQLTTQGFRHARRLGRAVDTVRFHPSFRSEGLRESWGVGEDGDADGDKDDLFKAFKVRSCLWYAVAYGTCLPMVCSRHSR